MFNNYEDFLVVSCGGKYVYDGTEYDTIASAVAQRDRDELEYRTV